MITQLASPSVCVVDDEPEEYKPILAALNELYVSTIHILGNEIEKLPPKPFRHLQLLFLDLHLTNMVGKSAASHTFSTSTGLSPISPRAVRPKASRSRSSLSMNSAES